MRYKLIYFLSLAASERWASSSSLQEPDKLTGDVKQRKEEGARNH